MTAPLPEPTPSEITCAAQDAVAAFVQATLPGSMPLGFVVLVEVAEPDGERSVVMSEMPGQKEWTTLGYLAYAHDNVGEDVTDL